VKSLVIMDIIRLHSKEVKAQSHIVIMLYKYSILSQYLLCCDAIDYFMIIVMFLIYILGFFTVVIVQIVLFGDVTLNSLVGGYWHFGCMCYLLMWSLF
jgi:hypothetical protein